jgi:hypothetical protein
MAKTAEAERPAAGRRSTRLTIDMPRFTIDRSIVSDNGLISAVPQLVQRLPGRDETRGAVVSAARRTLGRARDTASAAMEQVPEFNLPQPLQNTPIARIGRRRSRRPQIFRMLAIAAISLTVMALAYRWLAARGESNEELYAKDWPAQPSNTPGAGGEPREDDKTASADAEESLRMRETMPSPTSINSP